MSGLRHLLLSEETKIVYPANATVWEVTIPEGGATYQFRVWNNSSITFPDWSDGMRVDWGDGVIENVTPANLNQSNVTPQHQYTTAGVYTVSCTGKQYNIRLANSNNNYGKYVTGFLRASDTLEDYESLLSDCSGITALPSNFKIPQKVHSVKSMLVGTSIAVLPSTFLLHENIEHCSDLFGTAPIQYLPEGFTIPQSAAGSCSRIFSRGTRLRRLPDSFRIPDGTTDVNQMFMNQNNIEEVGEQFKLPSTVVTFDSYLGSAAKNASFDINTVLSAINPTGDCRAANAFGGCGQMYGEAPADKLWNNPNANWLSTAGCFSFCFNLSNFGEIPATWDGGKVMLEDMAVDSDSAVDILLAKNQLNYSNWGPYANVFTPSGMPDGLSIVSVGNDRHIQGTLAAGTYTFDVTLSNKWSSATATITLIVK